MYSQVKVYNGHKEGTKGKNVFRMVISQLLGDLGVEE